MRRNQRPSSGIKYHRTVQHEQDYRSKITEGQLRSVEASRVQELQKAGESDNCWLEKLVNNIEEESKNSNILVDYNDRNLNRKNCTISHNNRQNDRLSELSTDVYPSKKSSVQIAPGDSSTLFSRTSNYGTGKLRSTDNYQRSTQNYMGSAQKYRHERPNATVESQNKHDLDLNDSGQSYGRIKRVQKQRENAEMIGRYDTGPTLQDIHIPSIRTKDRMFTESHHKLSLENAEEGAGKADKWSKYEKKGTQNSILDKKYDNFSQQLSRKQPTKIQSEIFQKRRYSEYLVSREDTTKYDRLHDDSSSKYDPKERVNAYADKKCEKEDECKMEEMAKKLNMVLENINRKSKMIQNHHTTQTKEPKNVPIPQIITATQLMQRRNTEPFQERYRSYSTSVEQSKQITQEPIKASEKWGRRGQQEEYKYQINKPETRSKNEENRTFETRNRFEETQANNKYELTVQSRSNYSRNQYESVETKNKCETVENRKKYEPTIESRNKYESVLETRNKYDSVHESKSKHEPETKKYEAVLENRKYEQVPETKNKYESVSEKNKYQSIPENRKHDPPADIKSKYKHEQTVESKNKYEITESKGKEQGCCKYEMMKRSLGMSKHIPQEIILEQSSSSEINSQFSPRTQFLNNQFKFLFDRLDKNGSGELSKNNCALDNLHDEIKYLFGGVFSRIKYKNQKFTFKSFIAQCQATVKEFQFQELKEVLGKSKTKNITIFNFIEKETDSLRWNNDTHIESESKRSSQRSEVVKKYEFAEEEQRNQTKPKVNWLPTKYENLLGDKNENSTNVTFSTCGKDLPKEPALGNQQVLAASLINQKDKEKEKEKEKEKVHLNINSQRQSEMKAKGEKENLTGDKKDFERMCENLNNKLNSYLTTINKKGNNSGHQISLQFSQLSKHWHSKS